MLLLSSADFFRIIFSKNSFRKAIRLSNSLDPDQDRHSVGPDLGPNSLQRISTDDKRRRKQRKNVILMVSNSAGSIPGSGTFIEIFILVLLDPDLGPNCLQMLSADDKSRPWQGNSLILMFCDFSGSNPWTGTFLRYLFWPYC